MKYFILITLLCTLTEAYIISKQSNTSNQTIWDIASQFALGIWKYANITMPTLTVPHN